MGSRHQFSETGLVSKSLSRTLLLVKPAQIPLADPSQPFRAGVWTCPDEPMVPVQEGMQMPFDIASAWVEIIKHNFCSMVCHSVFLSKASILAT